MVDARSGYNVAMDPSPGAPGPHTVDDGRHETEAERIDRNLGELLQELRVAGLGVQVLFGFLLAMPFTNRFASLDPEQHRLYVADLLLAALATALLTAPVAYHRIVFRRHQKHDLLRVANLMALAGLVAVAFAISGAVLLVVSVVYDGLVAALIAAAVAGTYFLLWFVVPHLGHRDDDY
jgi:O-antigen/teichoic acid export membrane protein